MSHSTQENIRKLLELTGMTHEELGKVAEVQRSSVSHWTRGASEPRVGAVKKIARYFGLHESNIIEPNGMEYVTVDDRGHLHDDRDARMRGMLREMMAQVNSNDEDSLATYRSYLAAASELGSVMELSQKERDLVTDFRRLDSHKMEIVSDLVNALANPDRGSQPTFKKDLPPAQED